MTLSEKIKELRKGKGLTLQAASELTGISIVTLCNYENDKTVPTPSNIKKIADAYGGDYEELYKLRWKTN